MRLNALDESVGALVAVTAIVGMDAVEFEPDVDPSELDALVVRIEPQRDGDASGEAPQQDLVGRRP